MRREEVTRLRAGTGDLPLLTRAPAQRVEVETSREAGDVALSEAFRLFLAPSADVAASDRLVVRGEVHAVVGVPDERPGVALVVVAARVVLDCQVVIGRRGGVAPAWNPATRQTESQAVPPAYTGPAAVAVAGAGAGTLVDVVEEQVRLRTYEVTVPTAADDVEVGHEVTVNSSPDPALVGRTLTVTGVALGSRVARVLLATLDT